MEQIDILKKLFLEKFVRELIHARRRQIIELQIQIQENIRREKEIEVEKLKQKFKSYSDRKIKKESRIDVRESIKKSIEKSKIIEKEHITPTVLQPIIKKEKIIIQEKIPAPKKTLEIPAKKEELLLSIRTKQIPKDIKKNYAPQTNKKEERTVLAISEIKEKKEQREKYNPSVSYLLTTGEINFGKISVFINDPSIISIECEGSKRPIIIKKRDQLLTTKIKLEDVEIDNIIYGFSERARIPVIEGLLRARVNFLQISAVVSSIVSSRFIITKMPIIPPQNTINTTNVPQQFRTRTFIPLAKNMPPSFNSASRIPINPRINQQSKENSQIQKTNLSPEEQGFVKSIR